MKEIARIRGNAIKNNYPEWNHWGIEGKNPFSQTVNANKA